MLYTAKINDVVFCTCEYSTETNTSDSWIVAPRVQSAKNERYCFRTRLEEKSLSSKIQTLINRKLELIESTIPNTVA